MEGRGVAEEIEMKRSSSSRAATAPPRMPPGRCLTARNPPRVPVLVHPPRQNHSLSRAEVHLEAILRLESETNPGPTLTTAPRPAEMRGEQHLNIIRRKNANDASQLALMPVFVNLCSNADDVAFIKAQLPSVFHGEV